VIFLLFRAVRTRPRPFWAFWQQRAAADVYAMIPVTDIAEARGLANSDMEARGWRIERFEHSRPVDRDFPQDDATVRWRIRRASSGKPAYDFYPPFRAYEADESKAIESRYLATPGVKLDPERVPEHLRALLRFAGEWAIGDDVERGRFIAAANHENKKEFVEAVAPLFEDIERYSRAHDNVVPVPDEVIVLNLLAEAADIASHDVNQ
jgi:hypothetical protein